MHTAHHKKKSSGKEVIMEIIHNNPHGTLKTCYSSPLTADSILGFLQSYLLEVVSHPVVDGMNHFSLSFIFNN